MVFVCLVVKMRKKVAYVEVFEIGLSGGKSAEFITWENAIFGRIVWNKYKNTEKLIFELNLGLGCICDNYLSLSFELPLTFFCLFSLTFYKTSLFLFLPLLISVTHLWHILNTVSLFNSFHPNVETQVLNRKKFIHNLEHQHYFTIGDNIGNRKAFK